MITTEQITRKLGIYRAKLEMQKSEPIDYAACLRLEAQISLLEDLYYGSLRTDPAAIDNKTADH